MLSQNSPLVSIICIAHQHEKYVLDAIQSVLDQSYQTWELIFLDNSNDSIGFNKAEEFIQSKKITQNVILKKINPNIGYCATFNLGLALAKGKYVIDFAADDVFIPQRLSLQVSYFESLSAEYGFIYGNVAHFIKDFKINNLQYSSPKLKLPSGDIFKDVIQKYFISAPSMMFRKTALEQINGYDEALYYEDFDIWVRLSRVFKVGFQNQIVCLKRNSPQSLGKNVEIPHLVFEKSTYIVCAKIASLLVNDEEKYAFLHRLNYEIKWSYLKNNSDLVNKYYQLACDLGVSFPFKLSIWYFLNQLSFKFGFLIRFFVLRFRFLK